ncbi:MAG: hypothetical protein ACXVE8_04090 [Solirubrobacteraceae bacterium]
MSSTVEYRPGSVDLHQTHPSTRKWTMNISPVSHVPAMASTARLSTSNVSAAALKAATSDGDGRTGAAALNDGDAAAQRARRGAVDIKA